MIRRYTFDIKVFVNLKVDAPDLESAQEILDRALGMMEVPEPAISGFNQAWAGAGRPGRLLGMEVAEDGESENREPVDEEAI